jgi:hypothetical protein
MPGTGVYHLEHVPTWMPNVATCITRIRPGSIPPRDYEVTANGCEALSSMDTRLRVRPG